MLNKLIAIYYILRGHGVIYRTHLAPHGKHGVQAYTLGGPLCVEESSLGVGRGG